MFFIICICLLLYDRYCIFVHCNHHFDTRKRLHPLMHPLNTGDASPSIRALDQATLHFMNNYRVVFSFTKKEISTRQGQYLFLFLYFIYQVYSLSLSQAVLSPIFSCHDVVLLLVFIHFRICGFQKRLKIRVLCAAYRRTEGRGSTQLAFCRFQ